MHDLPLQACRLVQVHFRRANPEELVSRISSVDIMLAYQHIKCIVPSYCVQ